MTFQKKDKSFEIETEILKFLVQEPCMKIKQLSEESQLSRVTVRRKIETLHRKLVYRKHIKINKKYINLVFALISINFKNIESLEKYINKLKKCPRVIFMLTNIAQFDLLILAQGLDVNQLRSFYLKNFFDDEITNKSFIYIPKSSISKPEFLEPPEAPINYEDPPCGNKCENCKFYQRLCKGCSFKIQDWFFSKRQ